MITTNYEVYVQDRNKSWALHARFPSEQREAAVDEAKDMERNGFKVRVSRETYDTEDNSYEDTDIYGTRGSRQHGDQSGAGRGGAGGGMGGGAGGGTGGGSRGAGGSSGGGGSGAVRKGAASASSRSKKSSTTQFNAKQKAIEAKEAAQSILHSKTFMYIVVVSMLGLAAGGTALYVLPQILTWAWHQGYQITLTAEGYDTMMFAVFGGAFLLVAVPLGISLLPKMTKEVKGDSTMGPSNRRQPTQTEREIKVRESLDNLSRFALMEESSHEDEPPAPSLSEEAPKPPSLPEETPPQSQAEPPEAAKGGPETVAEAEAAGKLRKFVNSAVAAVKTTNTALDSYNKFAMHLYIAGAVDSLADAKSLVASDRRRLTAEALAAIGTTGPMAEKFYDKLRDYKTEERYARMADMGTIAMSDFLKGAEGSAHGQLTGAIQEWNRGAQANQPSGLVTLMFTDMVGSTDMTQDRGDEAAQEIVRRHNTIVRMALSQFGGHEIKHTGDGIMASFDDATGAIDATISIQRNVANHNKARPDQPLHLRIGLNAGKPIREENDMFGATVQLAARVCAATQSDQTLCTESVRDCSRGRTDALKPAGAHALKGFKDPIPLIEVIW